MIPGATIEAITESNNGVIISYKKNNFKSLFLSNLIGNFSNFHSKFDRICSEFGSREENNARFLYWSMLWLASYAH